jgi:hypothetical protein
MQADSPTPGYDRSRAGVGVADAAGGGPRAAALSEECRKAVAELRRRCPEAFAAEPLEPGGVAPEVQLPADRASALFARGFGAVAGGAGAKDGRVVWVRGDDELLLRTHEVRLLPRDGFLLVSLPVYSDQTQDTEVVVTFATGRPDAPLGLIMAAEERPRGDPVVVETWGDELTAAAWETVIGMASGLAAEAGVDVDNRSLLPAALSASRDAVVVTPQARHRIDRRPRT